ncbi:hypothetical protein CRUP_037956 [Coryphaenoides rupestris]|nr:hypothetical protein CRUP_037956 [Coryphaenoides rupestris]
MSDRCSLFGRHHVNTFDGVMYEFPGDCSYVLAGDCSRHSFTLLGDFTGGRRTGVTLFLSEAFELHLSAGGSLVPLPYASHTVFVGMELGSYKLWSEEFGFTVTIDHAANIAITLSPRHANSTCGLCGNFNSQPADEYTAQEGMNNVFLRCAHLVPPEAFLALCEEEACHCHQKEGPDCRCPILLEYARTCHAHGVLLHGWLEESHCSPKCPIGMQYSECSKSCSTNCQSLNIQEVCKEDCVDGCTCPGECLVMGQSHIKTFDGKFFTSTGPCQYLLARDCADGEFSVIVENVQCADDQDAVCTRSVTLTLASLENMRVKLKHGGLVSVNGMDIQTPMHHAVWDVPWTSWIVDVVACVGMSDRVGMWTVAACGRGTCQAGQCVTADNCTCLYDGQLYQPNDIYADHKSICFCEKGSMRCSSSETRSDTGLSDFFYDDDFAPPRARRAAPCAPPLTRADCGPGQTGLECARTCQNHDLPCNSLACIRGCLCPNGTVRHQGECIAPGECPCYHNNRLYASGQTVSMDCNTCVCEKSKWQCTGKVCDGVCRTVGEAHYITFDGLQYSFPGLCQYVLVQVRMKKPVLRGSQVEIVRSGQFYLLLLGKHISISWDQGTHLLVHISAQYRLPSACGDDGVRLITVEQSCDVLTGSLFNQCHSQVDAEPYVDMCVEAACSCPSVGNCACFCDVIAAYAQACSERGVSISWRSNDLCPMSCEDLNPKSPGVGEELCQWRYNTCGSACPLTCQHPEPLLCPLTCVEGCHAYCPPGQLLDEVAMRCVEPSQCQVCVHEGQRISHGVKVVFNHDDAQHCKICHCENNTLRCEDCGFPESLPTPRTASIGFPTTAAAPTSLPFSTTFTESRCDRAMDLAFLVDGSKALSKGDFQKVKEFIMGVVDNFRMGSAHTRAVILPYLARGVTASNLQRWSHCENNTLRCEDCGFPESLPTPRTASIGFPTTAAAPTSLPFSTTFTESRCDRAMDLAFLVDGSKALSKGDFQKVKEFIMGVVDNFRMGSAHTRAVILPYLARGVTASNLQVQKWLFKKTLFDFRYTGEDTSSLSEGIKYLTVNIYDKNKRKHAGRVAIILSASASSRRMLRYTIKMLRSKSITTLTVAMGPGMSASEVDEITAVNKDNRAYVLSSPDELPDRLQELTDHLCKLGLEPEGAPTTTTATAATTTTTLQPSRQNPNHAQLLHTTITTPTTTTTTTSHIVFVLEDTDSVGQRNFNLTLEFVVSVLERLSQERRCVRATLIRYSRTATVEIRGWELWQNQALLLQRLREIRWHGGDRTNTGAAMRTAYQETTATAAATSLCPTSGPDSPSNRVVFLVTADRPTDTVTTTTTTTTTNIRTRPILVGPKNFTVAMCDVMPSICAPPGPMRVPTFWDLPILFDEVVNITLTPVSPVQPTLLPPHMAISVPCKMPMDVLFLLKSGGQFEDMKTFVKAFIRQADIGPNMTQVGVAQYGGGASTTAEVTWQDAQSTADLLHLIDGVHSKTATAPALGSALQFAISQASGGRAGVPKAVVMLVTDRSTDDVQKAANEALVTGVSVFPIGVGGDYDRTELSVLAGSHGNQDNTQHVKSIDQLLMLLALDHEFAERICRGMCIGSSTSHVMRFDSTALKLGGEGGCYHTLLTIIAKGTGPASEVRLLSGPCQDSGSSFPLCIKAMEVILGTSKLVLKDDVTAVLDGEELSLPWRSGGVEVNRFAGVSLQVHSHHSYLLFFTPQNNEFTVSLLGSWAGSSLTAGLCGMCGDEGVNRLSLRDGSLAADQRAFISDWAVPQDAGLCLPAPKTSCESGAKMGCQALRSDVFEPCRAHVPVDLFLANCEEQACTAADVCELMSAYALQCRQSGVCVDWRSPDLCPVACPGPKEYHACWKGCVEDCGSVLASLGNRVAPGGNESLCAATPTEGCFCSGGTVVHRGRCVTPDICSQCVDRRGHAHAPQCVDLVRSCRKREAPGAVLMCDLMSCDLPVVPRCTDGERLVLQNPGQCRPEHACVCKKEECPPQDPTSCPAHRRLTVRKTRCCDVVECVCDCHNTTQSCAPGFITASSTNDCGCTETSCHARQGVCVVGAGVYRVGSQWVDGCQTCSCSQPTGLRTSLLAVPSVQCSPRVCDRSCLSGLSYMPATDGQCCGRCRRNNCVESEGSRRGDAVVGRRLRQVGEVWRSPDDKCLLLKCVSVGDEVFISPSNMSCPEIETPVCPLGTSLSCDTLDCCPSCRCGTEPECKKTRGTLSYIHVGDCQSEQKLELNHCEGKCRSMSRYSPESAGVEQECALASPPPPPPPPPPAAAAAHLPDLCLDRPPGN